MLESGFRLAFELRNNALRQDLAQLNAPLVEWVNVPDDALSEYSVLIQRNELAQRFRREPLGQYHVRRTVALKDPVWRQPCGRALSFDLFRRLPERQCLGLCENVGHKNVVVLVQGIQCLCEGNEIA